MGCDPEVSLKGHLTSSDGRTITAGEVRIECPELCVFAAVNEDGDFSGSKIGGCPLNCRLRVRSEGYQRFDDDARGYCTKREGSSCSAFQAPDIILDRVGVHRHKPPPEVKPRSE